MTRAYVPVVVLLALIWGASFMFIKVAGREIEPTTMMTARILIAAVLLLTVLVARMGVQRATKELRASWRAAVALGPINAAIPFTLIAWGEKHVDSGVAAIANASMPIFVALLALRYRRSEAVGGTRLAGIVIGLLGVAVVVGVHPGGGWWAVAGALAVVAASVSYAIGTLYSQQLVSETAALVLATGSMLVAGALLLPFGLLQLPGSVPGWKPLASVAALGVLGTALGQLLYYRLLEHHGSSRASLVTYLLPATALAYGVAILDESLTLVKIVGLVLILGGVALGSGTIGLARRAPVAASP